MRWRPRFPLPFVAAALFAFTIGCGSLSPDDDGVDDLPDEPAFDLSKPLEVMKACDDSFAKRDYAEYEALLDADFQYFPREAEANDFPWMDGDSWGRSVELGMIANLFAPALSGMMPPVDKITFASELHENRTNAEGRPELTYNVQGTVLTGPAEGFSFNTRLKLELVLRGETFKILSMVESYPSFRSDKFDGWTSIAMIKNLYR